MSRVVSDQAYQDLRTRVDRVFTQSAPEWQLVDLDAVFHLWWVAREREFDVEEMRTEMRELHTVLFALDGAIGVLTKERDEARDKAEMFESRYMRLYDETYPEMAKS